MNESPMVNVVALTHVQGTTVLLGFDDGVSKFVDLDPFMVGPIFDELRQLGLEAEFQLDLDLGTLVWPNGADLPPDRLRYEGSMSFKERAVPRGADAARVKAALMSVGLRFPSHAEPDDLYENISQIEVTLKALKLVRGKGSASRISPQASKSVRVVTVHVSRGDSSQTRGKFDQMPPLQAAE